MVRRVSISHVTVKDADARYASQIVGLPGHPIEDVRLSDIDVEYRGGGTAEDAAREAPENEKAYPEPSMFGTLPAYGLFVRHARGVTVERVNVRFATPEARPSAWLEDVAGVSLHSFDAQQAPGDKRLVLRGVTGLKIKDSRGLANGGPENIERAVR